MRSFQELHVWQRAMKLAKNVYEITKPFPAEEKFGLVSQMRRAAVSIPSNIAEGHVRQTPKEFRQFLAISRGSCAELQTQLILSRDLGLLSEKKLHEIQEEIEILAKMMSSLYGKI